MNEQEKLVAEERKELNLALFTATVEAGRASIKSATLINGGAAVAVLAFVGNLAVAATPKIDFSKFGTPIFAFALGVLLASLSFSFLYLTQWNYHHS